MDEELSISDLTPKKDFDNLVSLSKQLYEDQEDDNYQEKKSLVSCLAIRNSYLRQSLQRYCKNIRDEEDFTSPRQVEPASHGIDKEYIFFFGQDSIAHVNPIDQKTSNSAINFQAIDKNKYVSDLKYVLKQVVSGPTRSWAFKRLGILETYWSLYLQKNEEKELFETRKVYHRDFYNVRKVDTHVHHSSAATVRQLANFMQRKLQNSPDEVVLYRDGELFTLQQMFQSLNLTAYDINTDTLNMHVHKDGFHRFDRFNLKYSPFGESRLKKVFIAHDNRINGKYSAEMTKELIQNMQVQKYVMVEWRISIFGINMDEWDKLSSWVIDNDLYSDHVRWLVQIPRLFPKHHRVGSVKNFHDLLRNIFLPLFNVTQDPSYNLKLHTFLKLVIGFDSVDDESIKENQGITLDRDPINWTRAKNPPYYYWLYYIFANMSVLNMWRNKRGLNIFVLRPHCGEGGGNYEVNLAAAFLTSYGISHGILLRKNPSLEYLYYLDQIPIAMSPLSNNALFLRYDRNPFFTYYKRGMNVSLSTDDPLQFMFTDQPLLEEYTIAAQIYRLSSVDLCELARNSVLQSGFEYKLKRSWLGNNLCDANRTNVPNLRLKTRNKLREAEIELYKDFGLTYHCTHEFELCTLQFSSCKISHSNFKGTCSV